MKVIFDTHVLLDALLKRGEHEPNARFLIQTVVERRITGIVGASAGTDLHYIAHKHHKKKRSSDPKREARNSGHHIVFKFGPIEAKE